MPLLGHVNCVTDKTISPCEIDLSHMHTVLRKSVKQIYSVVKHVTQLVLAKFAPCRFRVYRAAARCDNIVTLCLFVQLSKENFGTSVRLCATRKIARLNINVATHGNLYDHLSPRSFRRCYLRLSSRYNGGLRVGKTAKCSSPRHVYGNDERNSREVLCLPRVLKQ